MNIPVIKVGILSGAEIRFALNGNYTLGENENTGRGEYIARFNNGIIELEIHGLKSAAGNSLFITPADTEPANFTLFDVTIGIDFHWQKKETQIFTGTLKLMVVQDHITAVNILPVEDYLISVISSEMSAMSSLEMLKAHAVISRSWLLAQIEKGMKIQSETMKYRSSYSSANERIIWYDREDHTGFDVCADDHCQRYQGITRASTPLAKQAVMETSGEVLMHDDRFCDTRFSKCCGGITELFENTWEPVNHPYLQRVYDNSGDLSESQIDLIDEQAACAWIMATPDAFCNTTDSKVLSQVLNDYDQTTLDFYRWKVSYSAAELSGLIHARTGMDFGDVLELIPLQRGVSGRIMKLKIVGTKRTMVIGKELQIRKALSATHLYSSAFVVKRTKDHGSYRFTLYGAGWGHGVGLCQIGAAVMGAKGYSYREILLHYYRGAKLEKRY
jgi:SpoIID/LytB domain protein